MSFSRLPAVKKAPCLVQKKQIFGPSYFVTAFFYILLNGVTKIIKTVGFKQIKSYLLKRNIKKKTETVFATLRGHSITTWTRRGGWGGHWKVHGGSRDKG